jgi:class 3 adenylate cyclase
MEGKEGTGDEPGLGPAPSDPALAAMLRSHGPARADHQLGPGGVEALRRSGSVPVEAAVVVGDLRMSTLILRESVQPSLFARFVVGFTESVRELARTSGGWFDKFTGDGFVAFWIYPVGGTPDVQSLCDFLQSVLPAADSLLRNLRKNVRNFPAGAGLSLGVDAGPCELVRVGESLTIVGSPTVGATRMVTAAEANQTYVNVFLGQRLEGATTLLESLGIRLERAVARTKEYPNGQEAYRLEFASSRTSLAAPGPSGATIA